MRNLFDVIPVNFFNYLASSSNHRVYADCLQVIYDEYDREISYRISRSRVRDALAIYLMENRVQLEEENFSENKNYNDMANLIIRKLSNPDVGWLEEEADDMTYEKHIVMTEAGIRLAEFLTELKKPEKEEFSSYIYTIYNTLRNEEMWKNDPYIDVLLQINRNAKMLSKALKRLATFIRKIIERMVNEETFESLTENIIEYCEGSFIKEYTRLTKQQNIHVYRGFIRRQLDRLQSEQEIFELLVIGCMEEEEISEQEAEERIITLIQSTKRFLTDDYDRIMKDIKHKINIYLHVAVGRMRFIYNRGTDIRGSVERTIQYIIEEMQDIGMKDNIPQDMNGLFLLDRNEFIDLASLRYPRKQQIRKTTVMEIEEMTEEQIEEARLAQKKEAYNPYSKEKMKTYVEQLMGEQGFIDSTHMPIQSKNDILTSLSAVAYSGENGYVVEVKDGYMETEGMLLRNFTIRKEEK